MFAEKFSPLINQFPQEADALRRLADHFGDLEVRDGRRVFEVELDPNRLFDISQAGSSARLARVTSILLDAHLLVRRVVIRAPSGTEIMEVPSRYDYPLSVYDPTRDIMMEVNDDDLDLVYCVVKDGRY